MAAHRPLVASVLAVCSWLVSACTGATAAAIDAYDQGRYPEALAALRRLEQARGAAIASDTRYTLYRGLTELALGNAARAHVWLSAAKEGLARDPEALDRFDRGRLEAAWRTLGKMPAQLR
ncbi:MAG TPA: hypothetical protein VI197_03160 [Polyangiaceae bacterium]